MKAMILAAGYGKRLLPLTQTLPKPLLPVAGKPLIAYHLQALAKAGIQEVVINIYHLGELIQQALGDGSAYGVKIRYSMEPQDLETGGGIYQALPWLGDEPFIVINADIWTDFPFVTLHKPLSKGVHIVLVDNPVHNSKGDFVLEHDHVSLIGSPKLTWAGISVYHPDFLQDCKPGRYSIVPLLRTAIANGQVTGEYYQGTWSDIGSIERYQQLLKDQGA